jgi:hypothetical protein
MCRIRRSVMMAARLSTPSPEPHVTTDVVMISETGACSSSAPRSLRRRTTSRSETMPTSAPDASTTTIAPTFALARSSMSPETDSSGSTEATSEPLCRNKSAIRIKTPRFVRRRPFRGRSFSAG